MTKRVLIVEDHPDIRELIRMTLELEDLDLHLTSSADEAASVLHDVKPDLVLLDVMLPGSMDGIQFCRWVKQDPSCRRTRVVMLSALGHAHDRQRGREAGADGYLSKPFAPLQLIETVQKYIG